FVLHALVLAAQALVVLDGTEDARAEQAVALRLERPIVDRLRLLDFAVRPRKDLLRGRDRDADLVEDLRRHLRAEKIHHFLIHHRLLVEGAPPTPTRSRGLSLFSLPRLRGRVGGGTLLKAPPPARFARDLPR